MTEGTSSGPFDLDVLTRAQILAVQTRAQKRRQQQLEKDDAAATSPHPLGSSEVPRDISGEDSSLLVDVSSGDEDEGDKEEGNIIVTDPFTRNDLVRQQKEDSSLQPLFEAARRGDPQYLEQDGVLYGVNLQPKGAKKIVVPTPLRDRLLQDTIAVDTLVIKRPERNALSVPSTTHIEDTTSLSRWFQ